jgi:hypothetical protein
MSSVYSPQDVSLMSSVYSHQDVSLMSSVYSHQDVSLMSSVYSHEDVSLMSSVYSPCFQELEAGTKWQEKVKGLESELDSQRESLRKVGARQVPYAPVLHLFRCTRV